MTETPHRSDPRAGLDGFGSLVRAEWTKFRTVRGWVAALVAAVVIIVGLGVAYATGSSSSCMNGTVEVPCDPPPLGPDGEAVEDKFSFMHQSLDGDGSITVRVTSMSGTITYPPPNHDKIVPGLVPWAKAGIIVKDGLRPGSAYAAVMVTAQHGVRMQHNFTQDVAGRSGGVSASSPRWLRLTRSGDTLTGYESTDGKQWTTIGTADLTGLPKTVQAGLFVTSPSDITVEQGDFGGSISQARFTQTVGVFDHVSLEGGGGSPWKRDAVGGGGNTDWEKYHHAPGVEQSGDTYTVTGSGDLAPSRDGQIVERPLTGQLAGLIVMVVVAAMFATSEYRRGLIRTTLLASPRRGRALAAKAVVIGGVTFAAGLVAAAVAVLAGTRILRGNHNFVLPVPLLTEVRVIVGTAALLALAAVLALALGVIFRRSVAAIITAIAVIVIPYVLATVSILPEGASQWLLRLTPAAGFAVQQSIPEYAHVISHYAPVMGYYPLPPWAGFAVLCAYVALALTLALRLLNRRDA